MIGRLLRHLVCIVATLLALRLIALRAFDPDVNATLTPIYIVATIKTAIRQLSPTIIYLILIRLFVLCHHALPNIP